MPQNENLNLKDLLVTSTEVLVILGITKARLSQLAKSGKLAPLKKNIYLLSDVLERKERQEPLREKYWHKKSI